jgi:glycolate oxidase
MKDRQINHLRSIVGAKNFSMATEDCILHEYDATLSKGSPEAVIFPHSTEQVAKILVFASQEGIPVTTRGAGTNLSGGSVPVHGGIALVMTRMNKILEVDLENQFAVVEPGVVNQDLQDYLAPYGYYYPPDPASMKACTIGGNIAECSGGPRCLKYGVIRDYIWGMEMVLGTGEVVTIGAKHPANPDPLDMVRLMVGSEGTLGVFTKLFLSIKKLPAAKKTMLCYFKTVQDASKAVAQIIGDGIVPTTLELMDNLLINCAEDFTKVGLDRSAGAVLLIEVDGYKEELDAQVEIIKKACLSRNASEFKLAQSAAEVDLLWQARRTVIGAVSRKRPSYSLQDVTVPRNRLPEIVAGIVSLSEKYNLPIGVLAHAGDGNLHPLVLFDARDATEVAKVHQTEEEICDLALSLGGTLSGEHGIGLAKIPYLSKEFSPAVLELHKKIILAFSPDNILNPGKIVEVRKK